MVTKSMKKKNMKIKIIEDSFKQYKINIDNYTIGIYCILKDETYTFMIYDGTLCMVRYVNAKHLTKDYSKLLKSIKNQLNKLNVDNYELPTELEFWKNGTEVI